jgi:SAM-dependent methyltransferase
MVEEGNARRKAHWERVFHDMESNEVSWYQPRLETSLALFSLTGVTNDAAIIDVGGGASTLVDDLLTVGFADVTVLDMAAAALRNARKRLGERSGEVAWVEADITQVALPRVRFDLWHDRAVFHFLVDPEDRRRYRATMNSALRSGGYAIVATFGPDGPTQCSGLDVVRYSPEDLLLELGPGLRLIESAKEVHRSPSGGEQEFTYACFQKIEE